MSKIEWTHIPGYRGETLNCVTGCTQISAGCANCYSKRMTHRLQKMYEAKIAKGEDSPGLAKYRYGFDEVVCHDDVLDILLHWEKPRSVFINSMSDTFHEDVPEYFIRNLWNEMNNYDHGHIFWILTKRSRRMVEVLKTRDLSELTYNKGVRWTPNIWLGVSVEDANNKYRIDDLRQTGAAVKFISFEPLLGAIGCLDLRGIDLAIIGSESGPGARPMKEEWVRDIIEQCKQADVSIFYKQKQVGRKKTSCPTIDGKRYREFPKIIT